MAYRGKVVDGVVVLEGEVDLPEGAIVEIDVAPEEDSLRPLSELLQKYSGCLTGLPSDLARNHDHYIHGTPRE